MSNQAVVVAAIHNAFTVRKVCSNHTCRHWKSVVVVEAAVVARIVVVAVVSMAGTIRQGDTGNASIPDATRASDPAEWKAPRASCCTTGTQVATRRAGTDSPARPSSRFSSWGTAKARTRAPGAPPSPAWAPGTAAATRRRHAYTRPAPSSRAGAWRCWRTCGSDVGSGGSRPASSRTRPCRRCGARASSLAPSSLGS